MIIDIKVPALAESISEAVLLDWKHQLGEAVAADEILIEIETDKVILEVPAPRAGVLKEIVRDTGTSVSSEGVIARIDTEGAATAQAEPALKSKPEPQSEEVPEAPPSEGEAKDLSPAVRKLVADHDLDPTAIWGSGKGGRLTKGDVQALKRFPTVNASIEGPDIAYHDYYDIGVAVGSPGDWWCPFCGTWIGYRSRRSRPRPRNSARRQRRLG